MTTHDGRELPYKWEPSIEGGRKTFTSLTEWSTELREQQERRKRREQADYLQDNESLVTYCKISWCENANEPFTKYYGKRVPNLYCKKHEELWRRWRARKFTIEQFATELSTQECNCCGINLRPNDIRYTDRRREQHSHDFCVNCYAGIVCGRCIRATSILDDRQFFAQLQRYMEETRR